MSYPAPVLLVIGPLLAAAVTLFFGRWQRVMTVVGVVVTAVLLWAITAVTLEAPITADALLLFAADEWLVSGRVLILTPELQTLFQYLLLGLSLLFLLAFWLPQGQTFVPAALATLSPLAVALMLTPFTFGAFFLVIAAAVVVAAYQPQVLRRTYGGLRYLLLVALTAPLLLFAGWLIDSGQAAQQPTFITQMLVVVCLILLAGFPIYIWVQPIVGEAPLLMLAFLFGLVQMAVITFIMNLLQANSGLLDVTAFQQWIALSGLITLLIAALLASTAVRWRDLLAYLLLFNMGLALLTLALPTMELARETAVSMHVARFVSLLLAIGGLTLLQHKELPAEIDRCVGYGRSQFWPVVLFIYGGLSLLGLPLTLGFAGIWTIASGLGSQFPTWYAILFWLAMAGAVFAVLRSLNILFQQTPAPSFEQTEVG